MYLPCICPCIHSIYIYSVFHFLDFVALCVFVKISGPKLEGLTLKIRTYSHCEPIVSPLVPHFWPMPKRQVSLCRCSGRHQGRNRRWSLVGSYWETQGSENRIIIGIPWWYTPLFMEIMMINQESWEDNFSDTPIYYWANAFHLSHVTEFQSFSGSNFSSLTWLFFSLSAPNGALGSVLRPFSLGIFLCIGLAEGRSLQFWNLAVIGFHLVIGYYLLHL